MSYVGKHVHDVSIYRGIRQRLMSRRGRLSICQRRETSARLSTTNNKQRKHHKTNQVDGKSIDLIDSLFEQSEPCHYL